MADLKISQLTGATTPLAGTEVVPLVQSSTTKKVSVANLTAGRTVQMSSLDANGGSSTGGAVISGSIPGVRASSTVLDVGDGHRYLALGANASTPGVVKLIAASSDASIYEYLLTSDTSYNLTFNKGNLIQGTAAKGVNFTANTPAAGMTSQLLNWYEEGTFTPTITFGGGSTGITYGTQVGKYIRNGRLVTITIFITLSSKGSSTGQVKIEGLPFTIRNVGSQYWFGAMYAANMSGLSSNGLVALGLPNTTTMALDFFNGNSMNDMDNTNLTNTSVLGVTLNYEAA